MTASWYLGFELTSFLAAEGLYRPSSHQDCLEERFGGLVGSSPSLTRKEAK